MKVRVMIDSAADITADIKNKVDIVPLVVTFGEEEFIPGVNLSHQAFYQRLMESDVLPTTSQASPAQYAEYFQKVMDAGESAVVITLASKLSGTYQSAMIAASEFDNIYVVDSSTATIGICILVQRALEMAETGMDAQTIANTLDREKEEIRLVAVLDTLEYMKRGGRISKTAALAGGLLNIKPVITVQNGQIQVVGKARGNKQANSMLADQIAKMGGADYDRPYLLGYTGLSDELLQNLIADTATLWPEAPGTAGIGSVIGTHAGPGAVAVAFFKKNG